MNLPKLGLGCAALGGLYEKVPEAQALSMLDMGLEAGLTYFDTAPFYGFGRSETVVGRGLAGRDVRLSTKVGRVLEPGALADPGAMGWPDALPYHPVFDYSYDGIMRSFEDSCQRLGRTPDILYIHDIGEMTHGAGHPALFKTAMDGGYKALDELRRAGDVAAIGIGVNETAVLDAALDHGAWDLFLLAGRYTLLEQEPLDNFFPKCAAAGTRIVVGGPFNSGILVGGTTFNYEDAPADIVARVNGLSKICAAHNVPLAAAALAFPAAHEVVASVIPGPRSAAELEQILGWAATPIPTALWDDLKSAKLLAEHAPTPNAPLL